MLTSTIHPTNIPLLSAYCMLLNAAITQKHQGDARISLGSVLFFKSTDINQAFGFCAESEEVGGKSQLHKGKAAGAGKNEQAKGFLCRPPGQGCRPRPRPKKGVSSAKRSQHPLGMWLPRGWEDSHRALLPGWRRRASGEPSHHIKAPGKGWRRLPRQSSAAPKRMEVGGEERSRYPLACRSAVVALENSSKGGQYFLLSALRSPDIPSPLSTPGCLSTLNPTAFTCLKTATCPGQERLSLTSSTSTDMLGDSQCSLRLTIALHWEVLFPKETQGTECI